MTLSPPSDRSRAERKTSNFVTVFPCPSGRLRCNFGGKLHLHVGKQAGVWGGRGESQVSAGVTKFPNGMWEAVRSVAKGPGGRSPPPHFRWHGQHTNSCRFPVVCKPSACGARGARRGRAAVPFVAPKDGRASGSAYYAFPFRLKRRRIVYRPSGYSAASAARASAPGRSGSVLVEGRVLPLIRSHNGRVRPSHPQAAAHHLQGSSPIFAKVRVRSVEAGSPLLRARAHTVAGG